MSEHEIVIRLGRRFDIKAGDRWIVNVTEVTVPFANREAAEAAQREIAISVRPVHDAGAEDYRPVVAGEVLPDVPELEGRDAR